MADLLVRSTVEDVDQWLQSEDNYNANIDNLLRVINRGVLEESMLISRRVSRVGLIMAEALQLDPSNDYFSLNDYIKLKKKGKKKNR